MNREYVICSRFVAACGTDAGLAMDVLFKINTTDGLKVRVCNKIWDMYENIAKADSSNTISVWLNQLSIRTYSKLVKVKNQEIKSIYHKDVTSLDDLEIFIAVCATRNNGERKLIVNDHEDYKDWYEQITGWNIILLDRSQAVRDVNCDRCDV